VKSRMGYHSKYRNSYVNCGDALRRAFGKLDSDY